MEIAAFVEPHQIAGAKPGIAFGKHIAQDFLFGLGSVGVTLETAAAVIGYADAADGLADLASVADHTKSVRGANGNAALGVETNDRGGKAMRQQRRNPADRARLAFDIIKREIAFSRRIKFQDLGNRKARLKRFPDIAAQAIAAGEPKPMPAFIFGRRRLQKIAA